MVETKVQHKRLADNSQKNGINISGHHSLCEINYYRMLALLPGFDTGRNEWSYAAGANTPLLAHLRVVERAPYTSTVEIVQAQEGLHVPKLCVRLYHDVCMAELISWNSHRQWQSSYVYPNARMYQPDEKLALNRFLGEWLRFCRQQGYVDLELCERVLGSSK